MNKQIRWRLVATYLIVIFTSMSILGILLSYSVERMFILGVESALSAHAGLCRSRIEQEIDENTGAGSLNNVCHVLSSHVHAHISVANMNGLILGDSDISHSHIKDIDPSVQELRSKFGCVLCHGEIRHDELKTISLPVMHDGKTIAKVTLTTSIFDAKHAAGKTRRIILAALVATGILASLISLRLASTIANPISHMNSMALKMAAGDLSQRAKVQSRDEIGQLAGSLNIMASYLQDSMDQLAQERDKMATIITNMADGIVVTDRSGRIILINPAAARLLGKQSSKVVGEGIDQLSYIVGFPDIIRSTLNGDNPTPQEFRTTHPAERTLDIYTAQVSDAGGNIAGSLAVLQDVTESRKQAEFRRDFVANVSHELRTPAATIRAIVEALESGAIEDPSARSRFIQDLEKETLRLTLLLNDLLNLSHFESGSLSLNRSILSVHSLVESSVDALTEQMEEFKVRVRNNIPPGLNVFADQKYLLQAIVNLLDNAIKYTGEQGSVTLSAAESENEVSIIVADTGPGIPPVDLDRIFERFYRVDKARSRRVGGTGLGLSIVRDITHAHGGRVTVDSEVGKGSVFTLILPKFKQKA